MRPGGFDWDAVWSGIDRERARSIRWFQVVGSAAIGLFIFPAALFAALLPWDEVAGTLVMFGIFGFVPAFPLASLVACLAARRGRIGVRPVARGGALVGAVVQPVVALLAFTLPVLPSASEAAGLAVVGAFFGAMASLPCLVAFMVWRTDLYLVPEAAGGA